MAVTSIFEPFIRFVISVMKQGLKESINLLVLLIFDMRLR